ncbi:MAG: hypothetical protein IPO27_18880 [Bacteroidetes bacterium]|nr:hypothetical protein [Bacteroidota bacterium]
MNFIIRLIILFFVTNTIYLVANGQQGMWTWVHGSTTVNLSGTNAVPNAFDPANEPPSLYEPIYWRDANGWLWIYGGYHQNPGKVEFAEMWCYNPYINQWKMVKSFSLLPDYGTKGVAASTNSPGARTYCPPTWVDNNGMFWVFGGLDFLFGGWCADLWMYNPATGLWTWVSGSNLFGSATPDYGIMGVPSPSNNPGNRLECNSSFVDLNNDLWLFGGQTYNTVVSSPNYNDLWHYNRNTDEWTWMHGSSVSDVYGNFGTLGVASINNDPPSRWCYASSRDQNGSFRIYGGKHSDNGTIEVYNDVWQFTPATNEWMWARGSSNSNNNGNYSVPFCQVGGTGNPGGRFENKAIANDACGNIYNYGGIKLGGFYSDMWVYIASLNEWRLLHGNQQINQGANYGIKGVPNANNKPQGRAGGVGFLDTLGRYYMYGGSVTGNIQAVNDVWMFELNASCIIPPCVTQGALPVAAFSSSDTILCEKGSIDFFDNSQGNPSAWNWTFTGAAPSSSTLQNPSGIYFPNYGTFAISLTATNANGQSTNSYNVTVAPLPPAPTLTINGTNICSSLAYGYQWFFNGNVIPNATQQCITAAQPGNYFVIITDSLGCQAPSNTFVYTSISETVNGSSITLMPNPAADDVAVIFEDAYIGTVTITMVDNKGAIVLNQLKEKKSKKLLHRILLGEYSNGTYHLIIEYGNKAIRKQLEILK